MKPHSSFFSASVTSSHNLPIVAAAASRGATVTSSLRASTDNDLQLRYSRGQAPTFTHHNPLFER